MLSKPQREKQTRNTQSKKLGIDYQENPEYFPECLSILKTFEWKWNNFSVYKAKTFLSCKNNYLLIQTKVFFSNYRNK